MHGARIPTVHLFKLSLATLLRICAHQPNYDFIGGIVGIERGCASRNTLFVLALAIGIFCDPLGGNHETIHQMIAPMLAPATSSRHISHIWPAIQMYRLVIDRYC